MGDKWYFCHEHSDGSEHVSRRYDTYDEAVRAGVRWLVDNTGCEAVQIDHARIDGGGGLLTAWDRNEVVGVDGETVTVSSPYAMDAVVEIRRSSGVSCK